MKDYKEIAENVLNRRDAYVKEKKKRMKNIQRTAAVSGFCLIALLAIDGLQNNVINNGVSGILPSTLEDIGTIQQNSDTTSTLKAETGPDLNSSLSSGSAPGGLVSVNYSSLNLPDGQIGEDILMQYGGTSSATIDIAAFDESMLSDCCAVLEGKITDMYVKHYSYDTYNSKFGEKDLYHNMSSSVVYELEVDKVWYGEESLSGTSVLIEDSFFLADSYFSLKAGGSYVIPIYDSGETIYLRTEEYAGGDITKDSIYSTLYPYHPQIEVTMDGNYIVTDDWESLCSGDAIEINMDTFNDTFDEVTRDTIEDTLIEYHPQLDAEEGGFVTTEWRTLFISKYDALHYYNKMRLIKADNFRSKLLQLIGTLD